jgi:predicted dehydrogenase
MKILIAGFGSIGRRHFRNLRALGEEDFVFLRSRRSTLPDDEIATYPAETTIEAALAHRPEAVIVSNPTALHLDVAIPAARAGCHLFLEKPLSHSLARLDELQDAIADGGGRVLVGFQFRYHPGLQQVKTWLAQGAIGRPLSVRAHWGEYLPGWHPRFPDPTLADAILDRLLHNAYRIDLQGDSQRKLRAQPFFPST